MNKLLLPIALILFGCSSEEPILLHIYNPPVIETKAEILSITFNEYQNDRYNFTATVKNLTDNEINGKVAIKIDNGSIAYVNGVILEANQMASFNENSNLILSSDPIIVSSEFIE